ncbi:uncharacterized protein CC84DRAFT_216390 [Paraphaeosphaeria sporulosa]|uniref:C2H2-type domain-containing protein n=1 Tax=Paraphaeosphaeria sporulosa TaxID=1460663 RepID=A0A177C2S4_9PLEO|nr:uncharacterized protein CC84DRAFT_216390 [Paraphaeosphaeria sporulosa]OAG01745.1 hypothetical protein CC84DRAFT_216390 [Paraphaeosphaeria sporulosa]
MHAFALFFLCFVHRDGSAAQPLPAQMTTQTKPPLSKRTRCKFFVGSKACLRATGPPYSHSSHFCRHCRRHSKSYFLGLRTPNATMADFPPDLSPEQAPTTNLPFTTTRPTPTPEAQVTPALNGSLFSLARELTSYFLGQTLHIPTFISDHPLNTLFASAAVGIGARLLYNDHAARSRSRVQLAVFHILRILQANPSYWHHVSDESNWPAFRQHVVEEVRLAVEKHHISRSEGEQVKKVIEKRLINMLWDYEGSLRGEVIRKRRKLLADQMEDNKAKESYLAKKRRETRNPLWPSQTPRPPPQPPGVVAAKKPLPSWDDDMDGGNEGDDTGGAAPVVDSATPGNPVVYPALLHSHGIAATPAPVSRPPNSSLDEAAAREAAMAPLYNRFSNSPAITGTVGLPRPPLPHGYDGLGVPYGAQPRPQPGRPDNAAVNARRPNSRNNTTLGSKPSSNVALPPMTSNANRPNVPKVDAVQPPTSGHPATPAPLSRLTMSQPAPPPTNDTVGTSASTSRPTSKVARPPAATSTNHPEDAPVMVSVRPPKMTVRYRAVPFKPIVPDERERRRLIGDEGRRWWPCAICDMMVDVAPLPWKLHLRSVPHLAKASSTQEKEKQKEIEAEAEDGDIAEEVEELVENATSRPPSPKWTCHICGKKLLLSQMSEHEAYHKKKEDEAAASKKRFEQFASGNAVTGTLNATSSGFSGSGSISGFSGFKTTAHPSVTKALKDDENLSWRCPLCDRLVPLAEKSKHLMEHLKEGETGINDDDIWINCPGCGLSMHENDLSAHWQEGCEGNLLVGQEEDPYVRYIYCGRCNMQVLADEWDAHVERYHQDPPTSGDDDQNNGDQNGGANGNTNAFGQLIKLPKTNTPAPPSVNGPTPVPPPSAQLDDLRRLSQPAIAVSTEITAIPDGQVVIMSTPTTPAPGLPQQLQPRSAVPASASVSTDGVVTATPTPNPQHPQLSQNSTPTLPQYPHYPQLPHNALYPHIRPRPSLLEREERKAWHAVGLKTVEQYWTKVKKGLSPIIELEEEDEGYTPDSARLARLAKQGKIPWPAGLLPMGTGVAVNREVEEEIQQGKLVSKFQVMLSCADGCADNTPNGVPGGDINPADSYINNDPAAYLGATPTPAPRPPQDVDSDDPDGLYKPPSPRPQPNTRPPPTQPTRIRRPPTSPQVAVPPRRQSTSTSIPRPVSQPRLQSPAPVSQRPAVKRRSSAASATSATSQSKITKPDAKTANKKPPAKGRTSRQSPVGSQTWTGIPSVPPPTAPPATPGGRRNGSVPPTPETRRSGRANRFEGTYKE